MTSWKLAEIILGGIATLAIFSFVIKENPLYRTFEHLFIGIAAGFGVMATIKQFVWPIILMPLFGLDIVTYPDGTTSQPYNTLNLLYIAPLLFGLLYYFIFSQKYSWLARLVIGFSLGMSGGIAFQSFFNEMLPQITGTFKPLVVISSGNIDWVVSLQNTLFVATVLSVMYYFFFSFKRTSTGGAAVASTGRWLMMVCFGAFFGSTIMARMSLLVERLLFLYDDWINALRTIIL